MRSLLLAALILSFPAMASAGGTSVVVSFYSQALGSHRDMQIYLPEDYHPEGTERYPAVYCLHGALQDHLSNPVLLGVLDSLITREIIAPVIVVKPESNAGPFRGICWYTSSELNGNVEGYIVHDVVDYVDATFRTVPSRHARGIMGHSMGGFGCMKLGLKNPDRYRGAASLAGHPDLGVGMEHWRPLILAENGGQPPYTYDPSAGTFSYGVFSAAASFSPNPSNPPWFVDLPLDSTGALVDSVMAKWRRHSPHYLASLLPDGPAASEHDFGIYFDCGSTDKFLLHPFNAAFADTLEELGIPHSWVSFEGGHGDHLPKRFASALTFLDSLFQHTVSAISPR